MRTIFTLFLSPLLLSSCVSLGYYGSAYPSTSNVDVFVDPSAITKAYTVMGKSIIDQTAEGWATPELIQKRATELAMKKGADAILIGDRMYRYEGDRIHSTTIADSIGKTHFTSTKAFSSPSLSHERTIYFLKYK